MTTKDIVFYAMAAYLYSLCHGLYAALTAQTSAIPKSKIVLWTFIVMPISFILMPLSYLFFAGGYMTRILNEINKTNTIRHKKRIKI